MPHPLKDIEGVLEVEGEPEVVKLALGDGELLPVEHCETERVAQWLIEELLAPLPLRVPEGVTDAVPRKPSAAAPSDALGFEVPHSLFDAEGV